MKKINFKSYVRRVAEDIKDLKFVLRRGGGSSLEKLFVKNINGSQLG